MQEEENAIMYHLKSYFPFLSFYWEGGGGLLLVVMKSWCFTSFSMVLRWGIYFKHEQYMYWKIEGDDFVEDVCVTFN